MKALYGKMSIVQKMTAAFLVICIVSLSLSSTVISLASMRSINRRTENMARAVSAQVAANMQHFIQSYQGLMMAVLVDSDVLSALARGTVPVSAQAEYQTQINRLLFRLIKIQPDLVYAGLVLENGMSFQTGVTGETADTSCLMEKAWMREFIGAPDTFAVVPMHAGEYTNRFGHGSVISAVQKLYGPSGRYAGVIVLDVETASLVDLGDPTLIEENLQGVRVVVENARHQILYDSLGESADTPADAYGFRIYEKPEEGFITLSQELPEEGITVHTLYPRTTLRLLHRELIGVSALSVIICILLSCCCAFLFSRSFTRPITRLRQAISRAENEEYVRVEGRVNQDEFGELILHYNRMVERIEYLIRQVYQKDLQKKNAQLIALQTQINPHMMFNTLESIRMKALLAGNQDVAEMTSLLGKMFRVALTSANERHTVQNELDYVRSFLALQNRRYRTENTLEVDVEEALLPVPCMVILFQPLVENSLSHGSAGPDVPLHIRIVGRREAGGMRFQVSDDGTGMDPDTLMTLSDHLEAIRQGRFGMQPYDTDGKQHIGLENIAKRLQLQFGAQAWLRIVHSNETGTEIEIGMPALDRSDAAHREEPAWM